MKTYIRFSNLVLLRTSCAASFLAFFAFIAGCSSEPESHVVSAPPPPAPVTSTTTSSPVAVTTPNQMTQSVTTTTTPTANGTPIVNSVVTQAPPAPQQETVQVRPSSKHVWIAGYWSWRENQYQWISGRWEIPPSSDAVWVPPRWEQQSDGTFKFYEGYWK